MDEFERISAIAYLANTLIPGRRERRWCDRCSTSAGYRYELFVMNEQTGEPHPVWVLTGCRRCDEDV